MVPGFSFVQGLVGVFGAGAARVPLDAPAGLGFSSRAEDAGEGWKVLALGSTEATLGERAGKEAAGARTWFKGRPFPMDDGRETGSLAAEDAAGIEKALRGLDGRFSLLRVGSDGAAVCATDLLGAGSIFHARRAGRVYVATHLGLLRANLPGPQRDDRLGVASILVSRAMLDGRTPIEGVHRLTASGYLRIFPRGEEGGGGACAAGVYARPEEELLDPAPPRQSPRERIDGFGDLLRRSLERERWSEDVGVLLSGGRDSKAIALGLRQLGAGPIPTATIGEPRSRDVAGARETAWKLGLRHTTVAYDGWNLGTYARRIVALNGGATGLEASHMMPAYEHAGRRWKRIMTGYMGGLTGAGLPANGEASFADVDRMLFRHRTNRDVRIEGHLPEEILQLEEEQRRAFEREDGLSPHQKVMWTNWTQRQSGWVSLNFDLAETYAEASHPFFYRPLLRYMFNQPLEWLGGRRLYDAWIAAAEREVGGRSPLSGRVAAKGHRILSRVDDRLHRWRHGGRNRPGNITWKDRVVRSWPWLAGQAALHEGSDVNGCIARESLGRWAMLQPEQFPAAFFALPLCMAHRLRGEGGAGAVRDAAAGDRMREAREARPRPAA